MGRNRKRSGIGVVQSATSNIVGDVLSLPQGENAPVQQPTPSPVPYTVNKALALVSNVTYDRNAPYEIITMVDDDGNVIMQKNGGGRSASIPRTSDIPWNRAAMITHNHPTASSFSSEDFIAMHERGLSAMEARAPIFNTTERKFVNDIIAAMMATAEITPLRMNPYEPNPTTRRETNQLIKLFHKYWDSELKRFSKNKKKPWRFVVANPDAIRNPPAAQRLTADTSMEELVALLITEGQSQRNPNNQIAANVMIPRRKQIVRSALQSQDMSESTLRGYTAGVRLALRESAFWKRNPSRAQELTNMIINAMLSHVSNKVALKDSTYQYDVIFE